MKTAVLAGIFLRDVLPGMLASWLQFYAAGPGSEFGEWPFRGKRIIAAVLEDLFLQHGLGNATHVLLTGNSAGGVGAMNNADWIGSVLR